VRAALLLLITAGCAFASPIPTVSLCDQRSLPGWQGSPVGNVSLGSKKLTSDATAQQPKASRDGWVGWIDCSEQQQPERLLIVKGVPIGSRLILRNPSGSLITIPSEKPIIEQWGFDSDGLHVVVKSRALHGPAVIERFVMKDGSKSGTSPAYGSAIPKWASPYSE
jgi:hypothetical protein